MPAGERNGAAISKLMAHCGAQTAPSEKNQLGDASFKKHRTSTLGLREAVLTDEKLRSHDSNASAAGAKAR